MFLPTHIHTSSCDTTQQTRTVGHLPHHKWHSRGMDAPPPAPVIVLLLILLHRVFVWVGGGGGVGGERPLDHHERLAAAVVCQGQAQQLLSE